MTRGRVAKKITIHNYDSTYIFSFCLPFEQCPANSIDLIRNSQIQKCFCNIYLTKIRTANPGPNETDSVVFFLLPLVIFGSNSFTFLSPSLIGVAMPTPRWKPQTVPKYPLQLASQILGLQDPSRISAKIELNLNILE